MLYTSRGNDISLILNFYSVFNQIPTEKKITFSSPNNHFFFQSEVSIFQRKTKTYNTEANLLSLHKKHSCILFMCVIYRYFALKDRKKEYKIWQCQ